MTALPRRIVSRGTLAEDGPTAYDAALWMFYVKPAACGQSAECFTWNGRSVFKDRQLAASAPTLPNSSEAIASTPRWQFQPAAGFEPHDGPPNCR
jgi:hypothetical protein